MVIVARLVVAPAHEAVRQVLLGRDPVGVGEKIEHPTVADRVGAGVVGVTHDVGNGLALVVLGVLARRLVGPAAGVRLGAQTQLDDGLGQEVAGTRQSHLPGGLAGQDHTCHDLRIGQSHHLVGGAGDAADRRLDVARLQQHGKVVERGVSV